MSLRVAALKPTTLKSSLSASASSVVLASLEDRHGNGVTLATFGEFGTIVIKNGDQWECIKFDALANNADGSVTLTVATSGRKILPVYPYTGSATGFDFTAGSNVIVTNDGLIVSKLGNVENPQTWSEIQTFTQPPVVPTPASGTDAANKDYVDGVAIAGAPDAATSAKGVTKLSVAPVSPTAPIAVGDNDGRLPTQSENDALVGTAGTPSSTNKFVTNDDTATSGNSKILRLASDGKLPALDASSLTNIPTAVISYDTTQANIGASSTAEQTVYSVAIPAGTLGTSRMVDIKAIAERITAISTATATLRFKYGTTTLATVVVNPGATRDYAAAVVQMYLGSAGTTGTQKFNVYIHAGETETSRTYYVTADGTASEDSTGALNFVVTIQYSASDVNNRWAKRLLVAKRT